ncbi:unnamed protein product [Peniophora sp. CBMAI 1063]|nr:unnamed protein product [Peniophora sp. CBMAI 1063]
MVRTYAEDRLVFKAHVGERKLNVSRNTAKTCGLRHCRTWTPESLKVCAKCRNIFYCCPEHQREDWKRHKPMCIAHRSTEARAMAATPNNLPPGVTSLMQLKDILEDFAKLHERALASIIGRALAFRRGKKRLPLDFRTEYIGFWVRWRGEDLSPANTFEVYEGDLMDADTLPDVLKERFTDFTERVVQPNINSANEKFDDLLTLVPVLFTINTLTYMTSVALHKPHWQQEPSSLPIWAELEKYASIGVVARRFVTTDAETFHDQWGTMVRRGDEWHWQKSEGSVDNLRNKQLVRERAKAMKRAAAAGITRTSDWESPAASAFAGRAESSDAGEVSEVTEDDDTSLASAMQNQSI